MLMTLRLQASFATLSLAFAVPVLALEPPHVVLVSIDGMRGDYLWDEARYHLKIPNLKALAAAGSFAEAAESVTPIARLLGLSLGATDGRVLTEILQGSAE